MDLLAGNPQIVRDVPARNICPFLPVARDFAPILRGVVFIRQSHLRTGFDLKRLPPRPHRRHLDQKQKRELIADELRDNPERSNRQIGDALGVDDKTVGKVRGELEGRGEIHHVEAVTDTKGRKQPAKRPKTTLIDDEDTALESAKKIRKEKAAKYS